MPADPQRLALFRSIGDTLATTAGYNPHTPWWDNTYSRLYLHPTATRLYGMVGRGGVKSGTAEDFAITELLSPWNVPVGERQYLPWVSENLDEAAQRPIKVMQKLMALGIRCTRVGNTVELDDRPIGFKAFACRVGAVSGFRALGAFVADEEAKWRNADSSANPAREVIASLRAMCVTHPIVREVHISSPVSTVDYFYECFAKGDANG